MLRLYYKLALVKQLPTLLRTLPTPLPLSPCTVWAQIFAYVSITRPVIYFIFGLPYEFAQRVDGGRGWQERRERGIASTKREIVLRGHCLALLLLSLTFDMQRENGSVAMQNS